MIDRQSDTAKHSQSAKLSRHKRHGKGDVLAIIVDDRNGREYYVSILQYLNWQGKSYAVMYNYEPDDGKHRSPEVVIMRCWRDENGEQLFTSIRDNKELNEVFDVFFERYADSLMSNEN